LAEILAALKEELTFKAPAEMSGPNVHRLKNKVVESFKEEPKAIIIDLGKVEFIDLHGLILFKDLCDLIRTYGAVAYAANLRPEMYDLLTEVDLLARAGNDSPAEYVLQSA